MGPANRIGAELQPSRPRPRLGGVQAIEQTGAVMSDRDADFTAYLQARQARLLRTAYLLTGDQHRAEDLLQTSLAKLYLSWEKVHERDSVDAYVRRIMVNENNSLWRRAWRRREVATDRVPETAPVHDTYDEGAGAEGWRGGGAPPPPARAPAGGGDLPEPAAGRAPPGP